jgi:hypothetical protein
VFREYVTRTAQRWLYERTLRPPLTVRVRKFASRLILAWRMTPLKSTAHVAFLRGALEIGGFLGLSRNSLSPSSVGTLHQILHSRLRVADHSLTGRFDEPVVTSFCPSDGLINRIARWFRNTGKKGFHERIHNCE